MSTSKILITCPKGIPPFLKQELCNLRFPVLSENIAGVETEGSLDDAMRLNLFLRTGHRVLFVLKEFHGQERRRALSGDTRHRLGAAHPRGRVSLHHLERR